MNWPPAAHETITGADLAAAIHDQAVQRGRAGGLARAARLSPVARRKSARRAGKASARARKGKQDA